jgi:hypothetical protein
MLYCVLPIDLITGSQLIIDNDASPLIGKLYKFLILLFIFSNIYKLNKFVLVTSISIVLIPVFGIINNGVIQLFTDILLGSKIFLFNLVFFQLYYYYKKERFNQSFFYYYLIFTFILIVLNQLLGVFGFGKPTYIFGDNSLGTSGYFFETNSYGFVVLIIESLILLFVINNYNIKYFTVFVLFFFSISFSIATKLVIIGSLIVPLIIIFFYNLRLFLFGIFLLLATIIYQYNNIKEFAEVEKVIGSLDDRGFEEGITSGRNERLAKSYINYFNDFTIGEQLVGIGYNRLLNDKRVGGTSEMDFIDILKMSGLLGFLIVYTNFLLICFYLLYLYNKHKIFEFKIIFFLNIFFIFAATFSGHLFTSATPTIFLAVLNVYPYTLLVKKVV